MNFFCTRCERKYRSRVTRCLTCGGIVREVRPPVRPALALFFVGLSCGFGPTSIDLPHCEKLVQVSFRNRDLFYLTRSMRPREVPESYKLYQQDPITETVAVSFTERCP